MPPLSVFSSFSIKYLQMNIQLYNQAKNTTPTIIYGAGGLVYYDRSFWNDLNTSFPTATSASISAYETVPIRFTAQSINITFSKYAFADGRGGFRAKSSSPYYTSTYDTITIAGTPASQTRVAPAFVPLLTAFTTADVPYITSINGTIDVLERWPTTQFYISSYGDNGIDPYEDGRIVYSYEPATVYVTDGSIARTFPISGWFLDYDDGTTAVSAVTSSFFHPKNSIVQHSNMFIHTYPRANTYYITLYTEASTTGTKSANIYASLEDYKNSGYTLNTSASCRLDVYPTRQTNNFFVVSGVTVPYNYTATTPTPAVSTASTSVFISGYAPNLTVTFTESCTPLSFPISSYCWDFENVFDRSNSIVEVTASNVQTGFGAGWITDKTNHKISYKYTYPGLYNVTIGSRVSSDASYHPAYTFNLNPASHTKTAVVYVEEILPQTSFKMSSAVGGVYSNMITFNSTPMTVFFNASGSIAGSFPISKLVWDFGDDTQEIVLSSMSIPFPQNYTVSHTYGRTVITQPSTFDVGLTAYAFNTESYSICSIYAIGVLSVSAQTVTAMDIPAHLLETNIFGDNNLLIVMEGSNKMTFNYLISTEALT